MKDNSKISNAVIRRLPRYRRILEELLAKNVERISSNELSALTGYTASQIRQDFNNFGGFGQQGYGYNVKSLFTQIGLILGLDREYKMIIVGCGNLGQAIANYANYYKRGFIITAMFDVNPKIIGIKINDIEVQDYENLEEYLENNPIDIGIICTTKNSAQDVADKLVAGKVKGIWNFAPADIQVSDDVVLENVHLSDSLNTLTYYINYNDRT
ncbi:MAG TPA: redox-sensing transcriptional repressor Rex [Bacillota bacterium]|jgi:redox-sensing transcriptional repressor|nr:redox-sensing transcriptional repressor Rex [Bacillota bacterium]HQC81820.1 redox-sensing transcriptional repressor Rex [Bacillota bacterium]